MQVPHPDDMATSTAVADGVASTRVVGVAAMTGFSDLCNVAGVTDAYTRLTADSSPATRRMRCILADVYARRGDFNVCACVLAIIAVGSVHNMSASVFSAHGGGVP